MNLSPQTCETSRSASKPLASSSRTVDPVWYINLPVSEHSVSLLYPSRLRVAPVHHSQMTLVSRRRIEISGAMESISEGRVYWGHSTVTLHFPLIFLWKLLSQYLRRWHSTAGSRVLSALQAVSGRGKGSHIL